MRDDDGVLVVGLDLAGVVAAVVVADARQHEVVVMAAQVEALVADHQHVAHSQHPGNKTQMLPTHNTRENQLNGPAVMKFLPCGQFLIVHQRFWSSKYGLKCNS